MALINLYANGDITISLGQGRKDIEALKMEGRKDKSYSITTCDYRTILSAASNLVTRRVHRVQFLTHTFPFDVEEKQANEVIKLFFKRLRRHDKCKEYIWTKERQKNDRIHFHSLVDIPFTPILDLQNDYNNAITDVCSYDFKSVNSLRLPPASHRAIGVENLDTIKYMAKYIAKERGRVGYKYPCYGISKGLYDVKKQITTSECMSLCAEKGVLYRKVYDYFAVIGLKNDVKTRKKHVKTRENNANCIDFTEND